MRGVSSESNQAVALRYFVSQSRVVYFGGEKGGTKGKVIKVIKIAEAFDLVAPLGGGRGAWAAESHAPGSGFLTPAHKLCSPRSK